MSSNVLPTGRSVGAAGWGSPSSFLPIHPSLPADRSSTSVAVRVWWVSPLHAAAQKGDSDAVKHLISEGAKIDPKDYYGKTPLYIAAENGDADVAALLIDAGAEYDSYASDITRTFPVNGEFSAEQRAIYELVLAAQLAAIEQVKPGNHWNDPHDAAVETMTEGLIKLGILKGRKRSLIKEHAYSKYFMHRTGHWLGMDVHDVGDYKVEGEWRMLESGMVMTVEPGLYFSPTRGLAKKWWNIGVRIEDDVLVTKDGHDVLSKDLPKDTETIEALMAG